MKIEKKFEVKGCPTGLNASWDKFPWAKYPGGVDVTFALVAGRSIFLVKEGKHCYEMPKLSLKPGQVLADLFSQVKTARATNAEVVACYDDGFTFNVLVLCAPGLLGSVKELTADALLLSAYASGNPMAAYAARVLDWPEKEVNQHLPLPQTQPAMALAA
jgi:hypothetical protein